MIAAHVHRIAGIGGSERHLLALLPGLRAQGVEPAFVGLDVPGSRTDAFYDELERSSVPYARLPAGRDLDPLLARRLATAMRRLGAELVHTHLVHADVYGAAAAATLRLPLVSTKHNDDPFRAGTFRHVERAVTRRTRAVIAISEALQRFLVERVGIPAAKVTVVRYGLDAPPAAWGPNPPFAVPAGVRVLLAVARLVEQKGLDTAIRALPAIRREHDAVLVVASDGPERPRLAALARELGVADEVVLLGRAGDVAALYRAADVLVHPARWEGFGLVLLEAMLCRLPVVATRVSAVPEVIVDGETGTLVPPDDPDALACAVSALLADDALRERYAASGLERARTVFSVERMARETAAVYRSV
jgi:glycosyltransferase involved in cell wall biosynthesis